MTRKNISIREKTVRRNSPINSVRGDRKTLTDLQQTNPFEGFYVFKKTSGEAIIIEQN